MTNSSKPSRQMHMKKITNKPRYEESCTTQL
jgi:hypothetical protein